MPTSTISYLWRDPARGADLPNRRLSAQPHQSVAGNSGLRGRLGQPVQARPPLLERLERRSHSNHRIPIDWARSYWTPPLTPKLAFDLESRQIEKLNLAALVSISDHDNIQAPLLLRSVPSARHIPISVEWTAPYAGEQNFAAVLPSRHPQPAQRPRLAVDGNSGRVHRQAQRRTPHRAAHRPQPGAQRPGDLQPSALGSLPHRPGEARVPGQRVPAEKRRALPRSRTQRPARLGREPRRPPSRRALEHAAHLRRRPPWRRTQRQHQPHQRHQLQ